MVIIFSPGEICDLKRQTDIKTEYKILFSLVISELSAAAKLLLRCTFRYFVGVCVPTTDRAPTTRIPCQNPHYYASTRKPRTPTAFSNSSEALRSTATSTLTAPETEKLYIRSKTCLFTAKTGIYTAQATPTDKIRSPTDKNMKTLIALKTYTNAELDWIAGSRGTARAVLAQLRPLVARGSALSPCFEALYLGCLQCDLQKEAGFKNVRVSDMLIRSQTVATM